MLALTIDTYEKHVKYIHLICRCYVGDRDFTFSAVDLLKVSAK